MYDVHVVTLHAAIGIYVTINSCRGYVISLSEAAEGREERSGSPAGTSCGHLQTRHQSGTGNLS